VAAALQLLQFDAPVPLAEVARTGEPVFLNSESELRRYPAWCDAILAAGSCAAAAVPVWANGHLRGVLGLTWVTPHAFDEDERAFVLTLGVMCAQAIMRGHLTDAGRHAREAAEYANLAKTQFLQTMSHEFRTPLNAILGYTHMLLNNVTGQVTEPQRKSLTRIDSNSRHLLALINDILDITRIEAGRMPLNATSFGIKELFDEVQAELEPIIKRSNLAVSTKVRGSVPTVRSDRHKVKQIVLNLLSNALKFTPSGSVTMTASYDAKAKQVAIAVRDTGVGIPAADQAKVFEDFRQLDSSPARGYGGTGLGLSICRRLANILGGTIELASAAGGGSTFTLRLPAKGRRK